MPLYFCCKKHIYRTIIDAINWKGLKPEKCGWKGWGKKNLCGGIGEIALAHL